jgi:hypothetical protein
MANEIAAGTHTSGARWRSSASTDSYDNPRKRDLAAHGEALKVRSVSRSCPALAPHRRLLDAHEMWHVVAESYMDPVAFRRSLNALIPELRNISFLVQKLKSSYSRFDDWYTPWQQEVKDNRVMRWVVASRNRVVKEGDLDLMSRMSARHQLDWIAEEEIEFDVPPRTTNAELLNALVQTDRPPEGLLTVNAELARFRAARIRALERAIGSLGKLLAARRRRTRRSTYE